MSPLFPLHTVYQLIEVSIHGMASGLGFSCQHCGRPIVNTATIANEAGDTFIIGLDCMRTLINRKLLIKENQSTTPIQEIDQQIRQVASLVCFAQDAPELEEEWPFVVARKQGKEKRAYAHLVQRYAPTFYNRLSKS